MGRADRPGVERRANPACTAAGPISPDGRLIAHVVGNRVELIPLQPDAEELSYRRPLMQPNYRRYREGYDAARKANDDFAARFYLNLLPPPERTRHQAKAIIAPLFARLLLRDDVLAALKAQPAADPEVQAACLELAEPGLNPFRGTTTSVGLWFGARAAGRNLPARPAPGQGRLPART